MLTKINEKLGDKHNKRRTRNVKHVNKAMGTPIGRKNKKHWTCECDGRVD
jgi:hypothetical protein